VAYFTFEAVDGAGATVRGRIEARTRSGAIDQLLASGHTPLMLRAGDEALSFWHAVSERRHSGAAEFLAVVRELAILLKAGLPAERALNVLRELTANRHTAVRIAQVHERLRAGEPFSRALRVLLPRNAQHIEHLIAAGEASGHLPEVMSRLSASLARAKVLRERLISALTYPALLVATMIGVLWVVFTSVLPRLTPMFSQAGAALPMPTQILLDISLALRAYGWLMLAGALLVVAVCGYAVRRPSVRLALDRNLLKSKLLLAIPASYEAARLCRNLETLLGGGLSLDRALRAAGLAASNRWFQLRIAGALGAIESGARLKIAFAGADVIPALVVEFAAVGEETGKLSAMMREAAEMLEHDVETRLDRLTSLVLPAATLIMGLLVAGVMVGIVSGLLAVNDLAL